MMKVKTVSPFPRPQNAFVLNADSMPYRAISLTANMVIIAFNSFLTASSGKNVCMARCELTHWCLGENITLQWQGIFGTWMNIKFAIYIYIKVRYNLFYIGKYLHEFLADVHQKLLFLTYRQTSNISNSLVGNKLADHSDVVEASPVGAAPTTSSFWTQNLASMDWAKTTARRD